MQADLNLVESSGAYDTATMLHQYGAGPADYLLASDNEIEPVRALPDCVRLVFPKKNMIFRPSTWRSR